MVAKTKKSKGKSSSPLVDVLYILVGIAMIGFLFLITFPTYRYHGVSILDFLLFIIFAVVSVKFNVVNFTHKKYFPGSLEWKRPWLFTFLLIGTLILIVLFTF